MGYFTKVNAGSWNSSGRHTSDLSDSRDLAITAVSNLSMTFLGPLKTETVKVIFTESSGMDPGARPLTFLSLVSSSIMLSQNHAHSEKPRED